MFITYLKTIFVSSTMKNYFKMPFHTRIALKLAVKFLAHASTILFISRRGLLNLNQGMTKTTFSIINNLKAC